ncbi:MAG: hypothetical protein V3R66_01610 [Rhodospirillales bacterium]
MTALVLRAFKIGFPCLLGYRSCAAREFFSMYFRALKASRTWNRLSAMSDGQLARKGLAREDIPKAVHKALIP